MNRSDKFPEHILFKLLRWSLGTILFWFGILKFFDDSSPAESIASQTIAELTFGYLQAPLSLKLLGGLECIIGIGILLPALTRYVIPVMYLQMAGTILPLFIFPDETWKSFLVPTLLGQYIIKNTILVSSAIVLYKVSSGAKLITDPEIAAQAKAKEERKNANEK